MARHRRRNSIQSTFKDYLVPIVGGVLILILIYSFLGNSDSASDGTTQSGEITSEISFNSSDTLAYIVYPGDVKEEISDSTKLNSGETIIVEKGSITLTPEDKNTINLNKIAEFQIKDDGTYNLYSSDAWIETKKDTNISMRYATIEAPVNSVLSLTQNEAGSTIYVISGDVKVSNLVGISTLVTKGQKISVSRTDAGDTDLDISADKTSIDNYFQGSDWFIQNQGSTTLNAEDVTTDSIEDGDLDENTTETNENTPKEGAETLYLQFDLLKDGMTAKEENITITGNVISDSVSSITINNIQATIDSERNFSLSNVNLQNSINDLVVKVYDDSQNEIDRAVYSVYNENGSSTTSNSSTSTGNTFQNGGTTYEVDATKFGFTAPSATGKFSTTGSEVTIWGFTTAEGIASVQVNGFTLSSFNGSNWRYHAFERFTTLQEGSNQYKIDYYGNDGRLIYTDYYTIVKTPSTPPVDTTAQVDSTEEVSASIDENTQTSEGALFSN